MHDIASAMMGGIRVVEALRVESAVGNLAPDITRLAKEIPQLGRGVGVSGEPTRAANNGNRLVHFVRHGRYREKS